MNPTTLDAIKAGAYTALWTFVFVFGSTMLGVTGVVLTWASEWSTQGVRPDYPDLSAVVAGAVAAGAAAGAGFVGTMVRFAQSKLSALPGHPPRYD